jgi:hypothetical protein
MPLFVRACGSKKCAGSGHRRRKESRSDSRPSSHSWPCRAADGWRLRRIGGAIVSAASVLRICHKNILARVRRDVRHMPDILSGWLIDRAEVLGSMNGLRKRYMSQGGAEWVRIGITDNVQI